MCPTLGNEKLTKKAWLELEVVNVVQLYVSYFPQPIIDE